LVTGQFVIQLLETLFKLLEDREYLLLSEPPAVVSSAASSYNFSALLKTLKSIQDRGVHALHQVRNII
jgi:hypothetical protein